MSRQNGQGDRTYFGVIVRVLAKSLLGAVKMDKGCLPFALQSVLETLITKCHLTTWDVHGKGKTTTLVLRWDSDNMAAIAGPDQIESVSFARYRKSHQVN